MSQKRSKIADWARRTKDELNGIGGLAGIGGTALGAGGLTFLSGTAAILLSGGGALIVIGTVGYAVYKAVPPAARRAEDYVGRSVTLEELKLFDPPLVTLAIVGPSMAGKTTLRSRLAIEQSENVRTQMISAKIVALQTQPQVYLAILDGGGERLAQQFSVAGNSDLLVIIVDHSKSDHSNLIEQSRISETREMINQVKAFLDENSVPKKDEIFFLINKRDLWETQDDAANLINSFEEMANIWRSANKAINIRKMSFSNNVPSDLARLMADIKEAAQRWAIAS